MIGLPLALAYSNAWEWVIHKYVLHNRGKNKKSYWAFHWHDHHQHSRRNQMLDGDYKDPFFSWNPKQKELLGLVGAGVLHAPLLPVAPFFTTGVWYSLFRYYHVHKRSHSEPSWGQTHLPWHYDHHMGADQNANWCVTKPWFDYVMGTRKGAPEQIEKETKLWPNRVALGIRSIVTRVRRPAAAA